MIKKNYINEDKNFNLYNFTYGLITPLIVSLITVDLGRDIPNNLWFLNFNLSQGSLALIIGFFIFCFVYIFEKYILNSEYSYEKSILLGLLSAEVMVFVDESKRISMSTITLLLFFYFHSIEH